MSKQHEAMLDNSNSHNPYLKPPSEPFGTKFKRFLHNEETGAFFGRTPSSWGKIGLFYLIFYICLAGLFALLMLVLFYTLDPRIPTYRLEDSLIGTNPGLGFRPMPNDSNILSTLIWYKGTAKKDYEYWTESLQKFLDVYRRPGLTPGRGQNIFNCDFDRYPGPGQVCDIDVRSWFPCTYENHYNYHLQAPCIFIKLNKIYNWRPEFYNDTDNLPGNMPDQLKNYIIARKAVNPRELNTVWVSCEGETPADVENIGEVNFVPRPGFPGYFYPYENSEGYLSPIVAVHLARPRTGIVISIECKAWAKNIKHSRRDRTGLMHFELMID